jgi:hypothetical protein
LLCFLDGNEFSHLGVATNFACCHSSHLQSGAVAPRYGLCFGLRFANHSTQEEMVSSPERGVETLHGFSCGLLLGGPRVAGVSSVGGGLPPRLRLGSRPCAVGPPPALP